MSNALYHIKDDPCQEHDLYHQRPDKVNELKEKLKSYLLSIHAPDEQLIRLGLVE